VGLRHPKAVSLYRVRLPGWLVAVLVVFFALVLRGVAAGQSDLSPDDLALYERRSYGVDLPDWYGRHPYFLTWSLGDGQAFVTMAADLNLDGAVTGLANPVYRYSRVGFSWLGRALALGQTDWIPLGLFAVNVIALAALAVRLAAMQDRYGMGPLLGLLNPALYIAFATDTAELLGVTLAVWAMTSPPGRSARWLAAGLGATRPELSTALAASAAGISLWIPAGVVVVLMRVVGVLALGTEGSVASGGSLSWPLMGYVEAWRRSRLPVALGSAGLLLAAAVTIYLGLRRYEGGARLAWVASGSLLLILSPLVLLRPANYLRAAAALPLLWSTGQTARSHQTARLQKRRISSST